MIGFIIFNHQNSLVYLECDEYLRKHLLEKQLEFLPDVSSGFCSEQTRSTEVSRDEEDLENHLETSRKSAESTESNSRKSSGKAEYLRSDSSGLDFNALTHFFLPLVILWRTKQEFDRDPYTNFSEIGKYRFDFRGLRDQYVLVGISDNRKHPAWEICKYLESICSILDFCFGSLLSMISGSNSSTESKAYKRLFGKLLAQISTKIPRGEQSLQWRSGAVDIGAFLDSSQGAIVQTLSTLGREFQVYLGSSITLLVNNHSLLSAQQSLIDLDFDDALKTRPKVTVLTAKDTLLLLQLCPSYSDSKKLPSKPKHTQIWLQEPAGVVKPWNTDSPISVRRREVSQRYQWDIFRFEILPGTHLLCLGRSLGSDIVAKISFVIDVFEAIEDEVFDIDNLLKLLDKCLMQICQDLVDMIPDETGAGSGTLLQNLHRTAAGLNAQWTRLKQNFDTALSEAKKNPTVYPGATKPQSIVQRQNFFLNSAYSAYSAGIDAQVAALGSQLKSLMFQLVNKSQESAKGYKLEMFDKCWARLNASKLYQSQTRSLLSIVRSNEFRSLRPAEIDLDMLGYLFLCPKKRVCFAHMPPNLERESCFGDEIVRLLSLANHRRSEIVQPRNPSKNSDEDFLLIQVGNLNKFSDFLSVSGRHRRQNLVTGPGENREISEKSPKGSSASENNPRKSRIGSFLSKFKQKVNLDTAYFSQISEPVWCLAVFEGFTHRTLAVQQTQRLAVLLHERTNIVTWNFG